MDSANYGTDDDDNNMRNEDVFEERDDHDEHEDDDQEEESQLPGFRFYPTDEELVDFYLKRKVENKPFTLDLIKEIDIYKYDPWSLPKSSTVGDNEWYFFCKRGRKYRNSVRPNRVTGSGFWKATGIDKPIRSSNNIIVGLKKSLVYYIGNAGKGTKTDWMMHEFRLPGPQDFITHNSPPAAVTILNDTDTTQEAEVWTVCRIFKRNVPSRKYTSNWREISTKRSHSSNANSMGSMSANDVFGGINNDSSEQGCSGGITRNKSIMKSESFISFGNNDIIQNPNYTLNISSQQADGLTTPFPNEFLGHGQYGSTSNYNQPMTRTQIPTPADYQQPGSSSFYPRQLSSVYSPMDISSNQGNSNNDDDQLRPGTTTQESWDELRQFWSSFQDQHDH